MHRHISMSLLGLALLAGNGLLASRLSAAVTGETEIMGKCALSAASGHCTIKCTFLPFSVCDVDGDGTGCLDYSHGYCLPEQT